MSTTSKDGDAGREREVETACATCGHIHTGELSDWGDHACLEDGCDCEWSEDERGNTQA